MGKIGQKVRKSTKGMVLVLAQGSPLIRRMLNHAYLYWYQVKLFEQPCTIRMNKSKMRVNLVVLFRPAGRGSGSF